MNTILNFIPGFRTKKLWKMIIAALYYVMSLAMLTSSFGLFLFMLSIPFCSFYLVDIIRHKKKELTLVRTIIPFVLALAVFITGVAITPPSQNTSSKVTSSKVEDRQVTDSETKTSSESQDAAKVDSSADKKPDVKVEENNVASSESKPTGQLKVSFIDVGQADSILVQNGIASMLIDAGNNGDANTIINYIKQQGVAKLDYIVATHPHEDHIGSMDAVINQFDIGTVLMPKATSTTKTFTDVVNAIKNKGLKATIPVIGSSFKLGDANCTILAPNGEKYEDLNNYSVVIKLSYGKNTFLFTGDAEDISEKEILAKGFNVKADVIKLGHHGSHSSTTDAYLKAVNPKFAVVSVGKGNDYGHPHKETMDKLKSLGIPLYRTDESGTIVATSDGNNITFNSNPGDYNYGSEGTKATQKESSNNVVAPVEKPQVNENVNAAPQQTQKVVYYTPKGKSYHYSKSCRTLARSKTILEGSLDEAISSGHADPCDVCVH